MSLKIWFLATRPWSFVMTVISVGLAGSLAWRVGSFEPLYFLLTLVGLIAFHAASNMLNDYYDVKHTVDRYGAPTTRYRPHPLISGQIGVRPFQTAIVFLYVVVLSIATYLSFVRGLIVLAFTVAGLFFSYFYTADPFPLKHRALGEVSVFLTWGPLMVGGTYFVLTGRLDVLPIIASLPLSVLVTAVIFANNMRDVDYDKTVNITTLPIILGKERSLRFYQYSLLSAYLVVFALIATAVLPPTTLLVVLTIPDAIRLVRTFRSGIPDAADPLTAQLAFRFGLLMIVGIVIGNFLEIFGIKIPIFFIGRLDS
ncbi:MAG: prenyltransferase [Nitrososphaerota archaeon]|nr:prenyltransferase [Aigarchaeota archaeon]MDW8077130.1 prenyltransferase [Nitrososphaerota archaeon]